jgi:hypothetical protein
LIEDVDSQTALQQLFTRPGTVGKSHIERHLATCDGEIDPAHGELWRRLLFNLGRLAPLAVQAVADGVMFFAPDGRYRMQVFALEDHGDGIIRVFAPDVLDDAIKAGLLQASADPTEYMIADQEHAALHVERLDAGSSPLAAPYIKNMLGWNRKAIQITLVASQADGPGVRAAEELCELAAKRWGNRLA